MFFPHFKTDVRGCTMAVVAIDLKSTVTDLSSLNA